ncbi:hypothetical protein CS542_07030 [Pedobacter sp. IW39]|nr:hypothetical protein CS542_07030 [Pedobacter sp. IW39]
MGLVFIKYNRLGFNFWNYLNLEEGKEEENMKLPVTARSIEEIESVKEEAVSLMIQPPANRYLLILLQNCK